MNAPRRLTPLLLLALAVTAAAVLVERRPALPELPASLEMPVTTTFVQRVLLTAAWAALLIVLALVAAHAARAIRRPARRPMRAPPHRRPRPTAAVQRPPSGAMPLHVAPPPEPTTPKRGSLSLKLDLDIPAATTDADPSPALAASSGAEPVPGTPEHQPPVRVRLLGPFEIDGAPIPRRASTRELIAYLALHPHGATRDQLLEALWPDSDPKRGRPRLWQSTAEARRILGDAFLREDDGRYRLDRDRVWIDTDELSRQLDADDASVSLDRTLALWRGEPLDGADYPWADSHLRQLRGAQIDLLVRAGAARLQARDARGALEAAERGIAIDQLHEPCWRLALQAEAALGLRDAVAARYERLATLLDERLGLRPQAETTAVYREALS
jgi:DNA-binding SARP family transcriptional activator